MPLRPSFFEFFSHHYTLQVSKLLNKIKNHNVKIVRKLFIMALPYSTYDELY